MWYQIKHCISQPLKTLTNRDNGGTIDITLQSVCMVIVINHLFCNNTLCEKYHFNFNQQKLTYESASHFLTTVSGLFSSLDLSVS